MTIRIALIGDHQPDVTAHLAIPKVLALTAEQINTELSFDWLRSDTLKSHDLIRYSGVWGVPYSPYISMDNILKAIEHCRSNAIPYLGTCAGYQHAILEFARNQLGFHEADNVEVNADTAFPLISSLSCSLVEVSDRITLLLGSRIADLYGQTEIDEAYHCSYGINRDYLNLFDQSDIQFTGFDKERDPRVFELKNHPFFIGTAFQPERSSLTGSTHPLITAFINAARNHPLSRP